jgi:hypothetical protein
MARKYALAGGAAMVDLSHGPRNPAARQEARKYTEIVFPRNFNMLKN